MPQHPSVATATAARRRAEFERADSAAAVTLLQKRWDREDAVAETVQDHRAQQIAALEARIARLERDAAALVEAIPAALAEFTRFAVKPLLARIAALEQRPLEPLDLDLDLEARTLTVKVGERTKEIPLPGLLLDRGVWSAETTYEMGDFTSHGGSGWIARAASTGAKPGTSPEAWRLAIKRGRDGRDQGTRAPS